MIALRIPYDFLRHHVALSWRDLKFGLNRQLIAPKVAIAVAAERLEGESPSADEVELATRMPSDSVGELVERLADTEGPASQDSKDKWLYVVLEWVFENRQSLSDPLGIVEQLYADFDYPGEIEPFVRYMPMAGPDLGNREQNEARLYDYWNSYLDIARKRFGRSQ
jgi:hypothetical protein